MPEVLVPLPHPTYRLPRQWFILRRVRRRQIPVPRSPFVHFLSDCIAQQINVLENRLDTVLEIWLKMSNEQRTPWIQMTQKDMNIIAQLVPYYAECLRRGRRIASRPTDGGLANERSQVMPVVDHLPLLHGPFEVPAGPQTLLPPIVFIHGRRPVVFVQPVIVLDRFRYRPCTCFYDSPSSLRETRQQDDPTTFSEVAPISGPELHAPFLEAHRARYATPLRSTYQSQAQDTNHDQHEEVNSSDSPDSFVTTETRDNPSDSPDEQVELTFLEAQRNRYATPVRTTYYSPFTTESTADQPQI